MSRVRKYKDLVIIIFQRQQHKTFGTFRVRLSAASTDPCSFDMDKGWISPCHLWTLPQYAFCVIDSRESPAIPVEIAPPHLNE